jgi:hypothetical protein
MRMKRTLNWLVCGAALATTVLLVTVVPKTRGSGGGDLLLNCVGTNCHSANSHMSLLSCARGGFAKHAA